MPFTAAKCTQCNANLQVDSAKDAAICEHCGTAFIVEKAINNYNTTVQTQNVIINAPSRDFEIRGGVLVKYHGAAVDVVVPEGVVEIGARAFEDCAGIRSVVIPEGVEKIGEYAFQNCSRLASITFPESLYSMPSCAIGSCSKLKNINISRDLAASILFYERYFGEAYGGGELLVKIAYPFDLCTYCGRASVHLGFFSARCTACYRRRDDDYDQRRKKYISTFGHPKLICNNCGNRINTNRDDYYHLIRDVFNCKKCNTKLIGSQ